MSAKPYPKYKPSGVDWLGDVPEHWEVKRLKWVGEAIIGLTYSPDDVVNEGDGTLVLRSSNIQDGKIVLNDNVFVSAEIPRRLRTRPKDIVICTRNGSRALVGKTGMISEQESGLTFGAFTAVFRSSANDYMFYVFNSGLFSFQAGLFQTSTIFQLTNGTINSFLIPLPPSSEQKSIADFLGDRTMRLDALLEKNRALIGKLKEKRSALISYTVTKGLPPEAAAQAGFTTNPKLKPSGIEWLGDIPEHWEVRRAKHICDAIIDCKNRTPEYFVDGEFCVVRTTDVKEGRLDLSRSLKTDRNNFDEWTERGAPQRGDILFTREAPAGEAAMFDGNSHICLGQRMMYFRARPSDLDPSFLLFFIYSHSSRSYIHTESGGSTVTHLRLGQVYNFPVIQPPIGEQIAISGFLDRESAKIDSMIEKVETAIEKLTEYRTALITAAVTGKIDVRKSR